jgi:hypothetical protein
MAVHLLKERFGKCLSCGAIYDEQNHPGPAFADPRSWSLHADRCDPKRVAVGDIGNVSFATLGSNDDPYPAPGRPGRE